jgi:2-polyprenyl-3-methyl-5-hydroxy-6-metoxy-1,4-benzoquinol methylase
MELPVFNCTNCDLYVTGNSEDEVKRKSLETYSKTYWDNRESESAIESNYTDQNSIGKRRQWLSQTKYCYEYLKNAKTILEIGSGPGQTLYWFAQENYEVTGIEPDRRNVDLINKKLKSGKCIVGFVEEVEIIGKFDIIWLSHVFEHLVKPLDLLKKLQNNITKDGIIFIEVPNCENEDVLNSSIFNHPSSFHFSKNSLMKLVQKAGYNIKKCDCFRAPTKIEGIINRVCKKFRFNLYPYYPKLIASNTDGTDIRIIISPASFTF